MTTQDKSLKSKLTKIKNNMMSLNLTMKIWWLQLAKMVLLSLSRHGTKSTQNFTIDKRKVIVLNYPGYMDIKLFLLIK